MLATIFLSFPPLSIIENMTSESVVSSPSDLSPGICEGINRRRKKRTSIDTNIRIALEKSFLEVGEHAFKL